MAYKAQRAEILAGNKEKFYLKTQRGDIKLRFLYYL
jgi:hypothetical protein